MSLKMFGKNLKYLRERNDLTQEELCGKIRIKPGTYSSYENGKSFPSKIEVLIDICNALDFFDIYRMLTVNLRTSRETEKRELPAKISVALQNIISEANGLLNPARH